MHHWVGAPPNLYDISGSAHFINKCDNGIVVHRNRDPDAGPLDQVQVGLFLMFAFLYIYIVTWLIFYILYDALPGLCTEGTK